MKKDYKDRCCICNITVRVSDYKIGYYTHFTRADETAYVYVCSKCGYIYETIAVPDHIPKEQYNLYRRRRAAIIQKEKYNNG